MNARTISACGAMSIAGAAIAGFSGKTVDWDYTPFGLTSLDSGTSLVGPGIDAILTFGVHFDQWSMDIEDSTITFTALQSENTNAIGLAPIGVWITDPFGTIDAFDSVLGELVSGTAYHGFNGTAGNVVTDDAIFLSFSGAGNTFNYDVGSVVRFHIGFVPTPSSAGVFALTGIAALRRRRRADIGSRAFVC